MIRGVLLCLANTSPNRPLRRREHSSEYTSLEKSGILFPANPRKGGYTVRAREGGTVTEQFFERPILNSPYAYPGRHWELDADGQPTNRIIETRRRSDLITPVPKPKKRRRARGQAQMLFEDEGGLTSEEQEYNPTPIINEIRTYVET